MLAQKVVLYSPVSDERLLDDFVEQCLRDKVSKLVIVAQVAPDSKMSSTKS